MLYALTRLQPIALVQSASPALLIVSSCNFKPAAPAWTKRTLKNAEVGQGQRCGDYTEDQALMTSLSPSNAKSTEVSTA